MGGKNTQGGKKTRTLARRTTTIKTAEKLDTPAQMFGIVIERDGNHFKIRCSDNIIRVAPKSGTAKKIKPRLDKGSFVLVDSTDKKACSILSGANPPLEYMQILNPNSDEETGYEFTTQAEYSEIIKKQNSETSEQKRNNSTVKKGYNNLNMMPEYDSDEDMHESEKSEETEEVDKHGNTINKNIEVKEVEEDEEVKVNKSTKSKKSDETKTNKSTKNSKSQKKSTGQVINSNSESDDDSNVNIEDL